VLSAFLRLALRFFIIFYFLLFVFYLCTHVSHFQELVKGHHLALKVCLLDFIIDLSVSNFLSIKQECLLDEVLENLLGDQLVSICLGHEHLGVLFSVLLVIVLVLKASGELVFQLLEPPHESVDKLIWVDSFKVDALDESEVINFDFFHYNVNWKRKGTD